LKPEAAQLPSVAADGEQKARVCLEVVDQAVSDRDFLLGSEFGAADIMMGYSLQLVASRAAFGSG
jgi:glutathione S-transferase